MHNYRNYITNLQYQYIKEMNKYSQNWIQNLQIMFSTDKNDLQTIYYKLNETHDINGETIVLCKYLKHYLSL